MRRSVGHRVDNVHISSAVRLYLNWPIVEPKFIPNHYECAARIIIGLIVSCKASSHVLLTAHHVGCFCQVKQLPVLSSRLGAGLSRQTKSSHVEQAAVMIVSPYLHQAGDSPAVLCQSEVSLQLGFPSEPASPDHRARARQYRRTQLPRRLDTGLNLALSRGNVDQRSCCGRGYIGLGLGNAVAQLLSLVRRHQAEKTKLMHSTSSRDLLRWRAPQPPSITTFSYTTD